MCCGQTSILVNWHHIIDLYICRLHASPFELEYKAVGVPWISLIKIKWTNKKKTHLQTVQISINNKQCTFVCDCTLTFSTVVSFSAAVKTGTPVASGCICEDDEIVWTTQSWLMCAFFNVLWCYSEQFCCQPKLNLPERKMKNWNGNCLQILQFKFKGVDMKKKDRLN